MNALYVLNVTPRLSVMDGRISMIGKSNMIVTVNDRPMQISGEDLANYLKSIPSENIASIEIISNPPAKYSAEGNSGIVNIRLKTPKSNSWNTSLYSSFRQSTYSAGNAGGRFSYQKNNLSFSTAVSYTKSADGSLQKQTVYYPDKTFFDTNDGKNLYKGFSGQFGIDYRLNKKLTVGAQYSGSFTKPGSEANDTGTLSDLTGNLLQTFKTNLNRQTKTNYNTLNFHTIYDFNSSGKKLSMDADYFNSKKNENQTYTTNDYDANNAPIAAAYSSRNNTGEQDVENYSVRIEMQHPLEGLKLNYGGRISSTTTNNDLKYYDLSSGIPEYDSSLSNEFRYTENNQSLYFSAEKPLGEKWSLQLGLRMENTQTKGNSLTLGEIHDNNYTKLFPTAYLTCTPAGNNHSFSLNYGRRISRPRFSMLNPFKTYLNAYVSVEGNPFLEPSFVNNIELGYTFKNNLNAALYYSNETNGYSSVTFVEPNSIVQKTTMLNFYTGNNYGANLSYTFKNIKWLESYLSGNANYSVTNADYPGVTPKTEGWGASVSAYNSFVFNKAKTFTGSLNLVYNFPNTYINTKMKANFFSSMGLRYIMNKNLTFNLSFNDIFKTNTQQWSEIINGIPMNYYNYSDARRIVLTVSWRFGNNKINVRDAKVSNTEERRRAN